MVQLKDVWASLENRRKVIVVLTFLAVLSTLFAIYRSASSPNYGLLYAGLEGATAGDVVLALENRGVAYQVRGDAIWVDDAQRDTLRLTLASEGLPGMSAKGYELLDNLNGFGTTSQMFNVAVWRAREGELARSISSAPYVSAARVHIANMEARPFTTGTRPGASVSVTTPNGVLSGSQAMAIRHLVASAVTGLTPDNVAIVDSHGGLIETSDSTGTIENSDQKSEALRKRVQSLLEARVGPGNAVVQINIETFNESEEIHERRFDPDGRVAISVDTEEDANSSSQKNGGNVGVASNLPDGDAASDDSATSQESRTRERINYEVSEVNRRVEKQPGTIKRITVAALVNNAQVAAESEPPTSEPRSDAELANLRELVESAVGFDPDRGDRITIKSMAFQTGSPMGSLPDASLLSRLNINVMSLIQLAVLAVLVLVLVFFVLRPMLSRAERTSETGLPGPARPSGLPAGSRNDPQATLTGEIDDEPRDMSGMELIPARDRQSSDSPLSEVTEDPVARLRALIEERKDETVEVLRNWLEPSEEKT